MNLKQISIFCTNYHKKKRNKERDTTLKEILRKISREDLEDLIISIINGTLDEKLHSKLINQNGNEMETPKISNDYDNSTTYQFDLSSDYQDVTHEKTSVP